MTGRVLFDDDHEAFRAAVRRFLLAEVAAHLEQWRKAGGVPKQVFADAGEYGFLGMAVPERHGGGGVDDPRFLVVLVEEAMRIGATGLALTCALHSGVCIPLLMRHGNARQQERWLPSLAAGRTLATPVGFGAPLPAVEVDPGIRADGAARSVPAGATADLLVTAFCRPDASTGVALIRHHRDLRRLLHPRARGRAVDGGACRHGPDGSGSHP